jgi:hypothetical protein
MGRDLDDLGAPNATPRGHGRQAGSGGQAASSRKSVGGEAAQLLHRPDFLADAAAEALVDEATRLTLGYLR